MKYSVSNLSESKKISFSSKNSGQSKRHRLPRVAKGESQSIKALKSSCSLFTGATRIKLDKTGGALTVSFFIVLYRFVNIGYGLQTDNYFPRRGVKYSKNRYGYVDFLDEKLIDLT